MEHSHAASQRPAAPSQTASAPYTKPTPPPRRSSKDNSDVPRATPQLIDTLARQRLAARAVTPDMPADQILPGIPLSHSPYYTTSNTPQDSYPIARPQSPPSPISPRASHSAADTPASARTDSGRLRTRTLEGLSSQTNGVPPRSNNRQRVGSLNRAFELPNRSSEPAQSKHEKSRNRRTSSAGNQQRMSSQSHTDSKRQASPAPTVSTLHNASDHSTHPGFDPRTMLTLMHKARGRMKGQVAYRQMYRNTWTVALCSIDPDEGCLMCESDPDSNRHTVLVPDLRGCTVTASLDRVKDQAGAKPILNLTTVDDTITIQLKPLNEDYFYAWFASLLCWQPVPPGGQVDQLSSQQPIPISFGTGSTTAPLKGTPKDKARVIKTGKAILIEPEEAPPKSRHSARSLHSRSGLGHAPSTRRSTVTCVLSEDGAFKISSDSDNSFIARVSLALLCRSAVQRVHHSVWDLDRCMGIFPQYSHAADACSQIRPLFLAFDERVVYEAWFVLLRCFTVPELYGPENTSCEDIETATEVLPGLPRSEMPGLIRIERFMHLKVTEVKLRKSRRSSVIAPGANGAPGIIQPKRTINYYVDVVIDGQRKAKTSLKRTATDPYWYESFEFPDLAAVTSTLSIRLKKFEDYKLHQANDAAGDDQPGWFADEFEKIEHHHANEELVGESLVSIPDLEYSKDIERWWPLKNDSGDDVGEVFFKLRFEEDPILMDREYEHLYELLHDFPKPLTIQIGERIPNELTSLATHLLNIFQTTDEAENWLRVLCEEEIDGIMKETPSKVSRFAKRLDSNESKDSSLNELIRDAGDDRHSLLRDLGRSATAEANLLFRGNTLASKAMDAHMKRLGRAYLESTIAPKLRDIAHKDIDCEVNPSRVTDKRVLQKNWEKLWGITDEMWESIKGSADRCPSELRVIFRHIRECANDRYGYFMRSVPYSSVSGFLFLRFFCAAILSPQAFDILRNEPSARAIRTFTLVAKGLQGLANMTPFGNKEPWMENMNRFLNAHKNEFKEFIDSICDVPSDMSLHEPSPSYSTPLQIYRRLPQRSKEGFLSLPYHIDRPHNSACLVKLWLDHVQKTSTVAGPGLNGDLARFHDLCLRLRQRTQVCYERIERSERRSSSLSQRWVSIAERMEKHPDQFWIKQRAVTPNPANGIPPPLSNPPPVPPPPPREATPTMRPTFGLRSSSDWSIRRRAMAYSPPLGASEDELNSAGERMSGPTTPGADDDSSLCSSDTETINVAKKEKKGLRLPFGRKKNKGEKDEEKTKKLEQKEENKIRKKGYSRRDA